MYVRVCENGGIYSCLDRGSHGEPHGLDHMNDEPFQCFFSLGTGLVQLDSDGHDGSTQLVRAMHPGLAHAHLGQEVLSGLLLHGVRASLLHHRVQLTIGQDVVVDVALLDAPHHRFHCHGKGPGKVPLASTEEAQEHGVRVVMLQQVQDTLAQLGGGDLGEGVLDHLCFVPLDAELTQGSQTFCWY